LTTTPLAVADSPRERFAGAPAPERVYLGPFRPLRQRLAEAPVVFLLLETANDREQDGKLRVPIRIRGTVAFWLEARSLPGASQ
jgi:hypothetical protein